MFYSVEVLAGKGKLAAAWAAAHSGTRKLTRTDLEKVSIKEVILSIEKGKVPVLSLRTSSHILLGLSRILLKQSKFLYRECTAFLVHTQKHQKREAENKTTRDALKNIQRKPEPYFTALILFRSQTRTSEHEIPVDVDLPRGNLNSDGPALTEDSFATSFAAGSVTSFAAGSVTSLNCISFADSFACQPQFDHSVISLHNLNGSSLGNVEGSDRSDRSDGNIKGSIICANGSVIEDDNDRITLQDKDAKRKHSDQITSQKRHKNDGLTDTLTDIPMHNLTDNPMDIPTATPRPVTTLDRSTTVPCATLGLVSRIEKQYAQKSKSRFSLLLPLGLRACFLPGTAAGNPNMPGYIFAPETVRDVTQSSIEAPRNASLDSFQVISPEGDRSLQATIFSRMSLGMDIAENQSLEQLEKERDSEASALSPRDSEASVMSPRDSEVSALSLGGCEASFLSIGSTPQEAVNVSGVSGVSGISEKTLQISEAAKFVTVINARAKGDAEREHRLSAFVSLLELLGRGSIEVRQNTPYGYIEVCA